MTLNSRSGRVKASGSQSNLDDDHFKHLGKDLLADFSEAQAKKKVLAKLNEYVGLVDGTLLDDIPKLLI